MDGERTELLRRHLLGATNALGAVAITALIAIIGTENAPHDFDFGTEIEVPRITSP